MIVSGVGLFCSSRMEGDAAPEFQSEKIHSHERGRLTFICACFPLLCTNLVLLRVEVVVVDVEVDVEVALVGGLRTAGTGVGSIVTLVPSGFIFDPADADGQTRGRLLARSSSSNSPFRLTRRLSRPIRTAAVGVDSTMRSIVSCL
jgi:hypothetical protein